MTSATAPSPAAPGGRARSPVPAFAVPALGLPPALLALLLGPDVLLARVLLALVATCAALVLVRAGLRSEHDRVVWRWGAGATGAVALGLLAGLVAEAAGASGEFSGLVLPAVGTLAGMPLAYQGVVRWNRFRTYVSDPGDWLNGVGAVLGLTAVGLVAVRWTGAPQLAWEPWRLQVWLLGVATITILLGTILTVTFLGGMSRHPGPWLVTGGYAALLVTTLGSGWWGPSALHGSRVCGVVTAVLMATASTMRRRPVPVPATSQAPAVGALIALGLAFLALTLARVGPRAATSGSAATAYAGLAALLVVVRVVQLVRELAELADSRREALTDDLTGAANRRSLLRHLDALTRSGDGAALLVADVDRFKEVNDRHGHHAGDALLRAVTATMGASLPPDAVLARTGGDEFAVLLPGCAEDRAAQLAGALHARVAEDVGIGLSVGVSSTAAGDLDPDRLLHEADAAMYTAKRAGGGVGVFDVDVDARARERAELGGDLLALLGGGWTRTRQEVLVHYQPQLEVRTGHVVGVEALVRWRHPVRGTLPPLEFLGLVEELGLMHALTVHVLHRACTEARGWSHAGRPLRVSVNLSASSLVSPDLLGVVDDVLTASGLEPRRLVLEVTETTLMADPGLALDLSHDLTRRGVQLSIDDYGTGYSSLAYLTDLPAGQLKLDRAFTARVVAEPRTAAIVEATVALAHRLGLRVVAEGVEDCATLQVLDRLGADESQGYLHSAPLPPAAFRAWLAARPAPVAGAAGTRETRPLS